MKIISWNCQGAFRNKMDIILALNPAILIIQECESIDKICVQNPNFKPFDKLWISDNNKIGIGIFTFSDFKLTILDEYNPDFKMIVPINISNELIDFNLFAICANNPEDKKNQYIGQVWKAIDYYSKILQHFKSILIGDFNSNTIFDKKKRIGNHSDVVLKLIEYNIHSIYHLKFHENHGEESIPTFYLYRHEDKPFHLDYCFASIELNPIIENFIIGDFIKFIPYSDHMPLITEFQN